MMMMTAVLLAALAWGGQDDKAVDDALDAFKAAMKSTSEADRVTAVNDLAKVPHAKTLARLAPLLNSEAPTVKIAAARGLSGFTALKTKASQVLIAAMGPNAKETNVLVALYEGLGKLDDPSALSTVHKGFEEKDLVLVKAALQAAGAMGNPASIEPLIAFLARLEKIQKAAGGGVDVTAPVPGGGGGSVTVRSDDNGPKRAQELIPVINKTLNEITRESNGSSETWSAWWAKHKATFKPVK
jgi:HEAT repeat protein